MEFELQVDQHVRYRVFVNADTAEAAKNSIATGLWDDTDNYVVSDSVQVVAVDGEPVGDD